MSSKHIHLTHAFFVDFLTILGLIWHPSWSKKGPKSVVFSRFCPEGAPGGVPGTLRGRFLGLPGVPRSASGVPWKALGPPPGGTRPLLGSLWQRSEDTLKVPGIFLGLLDGFFMISVEFPSSP